jgi:hypothetical protein
MTTRALIEATERAYAAIHRLRDVVILDCGEGKALETAVADLVLAAAQVRNRFEEQE